jgi:ABC-type dipeptide/oligopeptide/nickel transport system permease component
VIEIIFNIPGMGLEIYEATLANDYPTIVAVFTIFGFFTLLFNLLADLAYAAADPRIQFESKK